MQPLFDSGRKGCGQCTRTCRRCGFKAAAGYACIGMSNLRTGFKDDIARALPHPGSIQRTKFRKAKKKQIVLFGKSKKGKRIWPSISYDAYNCMTVVYRQS